MIDKPVLQATKRMWQNRLGSTFGWLAAALRLCPHDWQDFKEIRVFENDRSQRPIYTKYVQKCSHCRKYRSFKL